MINVAFLLLGFGVLNRGFGVRTVYCSLLFSGMLTGLEWLVPLSGPLTDEKLLELFFGVILPALAPPSSSTPRAPPAAPISWP